jgi:type IV pilus assembly protein PilC
VRGGTALSDAFADHGDLFPRVYTASLLAGERSGNLDAILRRYVAYEKVVDAVRRKTISALIYPAILIALAIGLIGSHSRPGSFLLSRVSRSISFR